MKRYCQTLTLVNDPELVRKYVEVHSHVWPEVVEGQRAVGILSMEIYASGNVLFMIVDTVDDFDWDRDMDRLAALPRQAEWEAYVSEFQGCASGASSKEKWHLVGKIFDSNDTPFPRKVFVSGCYDLLHSGHIEFFKQASAYGDLYVGIGSDSTIAEYKHHKPMFPQEERLFMVKSVRYVKDAVINQGAGVIDFLPSLDLFKPDVFVVNAEGGSEVKRQICKERNIEYVELQRTPHDGLQARSSSALKNALARSVSQEVPAGIPTRLDIAGTWIDQPFVSEHYPGWAITISLEPTFEIRERCGLSTSTRNAIRKIWPVRLPKMDPETLARLVFCFENSPEREVGHVSGAQDSIGICVPGLCRHYYDRNFWPEKIETCQDEMTLRFLEEHLVMIPLEPRRQGCSVVEEKNINKMNVKALADAAQACWDAILSHDLAAFAEAFRASFEAQVALFPGMVDPCIYGVKDPSASVSPKIREYLSLPGVMAVKLTGAGGGGYLALVVEDSVSFLSAHPESIELHIRRS